MMKASGDAVNGDMYVLVLCSKQSFTQEVIARQNKLEMVLSSMGIAFDSVDGGDPANREQRNKLFALSGKRAVYPQIFTSSKGKNSDDLTFWGDWERFEYVNETGRLMEELIGIESPTKDSRSVTAPSLLQPTSTATTTVSLNGKRLLVLCSQQSINREVVAHQQQLATILSANQIPYEELDGADPALKERRNELFTLSGLRAKYPQLFLIDEASSTAATTFWGDWERFQLSVDNGTLVEDLGGTKTQASSVATQNSNHLDLTKPLLGSGPPGDDFVVVDPDDDIPTDRTKLCFCCVIS